MVDAVVVPEGAGETDRSWAMPSSPTTLIIGSDWERPVTVTRLDRITSICVTAAPPESNASVVAVTSPARTFTGFAPPDVVDLPRLAESEARKLRMETLGKG